MGAYGAWWDFSLFHWNAPGSAGGNGDGIRGFVRRQRDLSEDAAFARRGGRIAAGQTVDGDGFAFSAAAGAPRKKKRASLRGGGSADACECEKLGQRRS